VVDDSGRTALNLAQNRWIQTALRQAWNEATCQKPQTENVAAWIRAAAVDEPSSARFVDESAEQLKSLAANIPPVRRDRVVRPLKRQSRSLDQPEYGDMNGGPSIHVTRVGGLMFFVRSFDQSYLKDL